MVIFYSCLFSLNRSMRSLFKSTWLQLPLHWFCLVGKFCRGKHVLLCCTPFRGMGRVGKVPLKDVWDAGKAVILLAVNMGTSWQKRENKMIFLKDNFQTSAENPHQKLSNILYTQERPGQSWQLWIHILWLQISGQWGLLSHRRKLFGWP